MGRPTATTFRALELRAERAEARADAAERVIAQMVAALTPVVGAKAAGAIFEQPAPAPDPALAAVTARVRAEAEKWGATPQQKAKNLNYAYDLARKGQSETDIIAAIRRGETVQL